MSNNIVIESTEYKYLQDSAIIYSDYSKNSNISIEDCNFIELNTYGDHDYGGAISLCGFNNVILIRNYGLSCNCNTMGILIYSKTCDSIHIDSFSALNCGKNNGESVIYNFKSNLYSINCNITLCDSQKCAAITVFDGESKVCLSSFNYNKADSIVHYNTDKHVLRSILLSKNFANSALILANQNSSLFLSNISLIDNTIMSNIPYYGNIINSTHSDLRLSLINLLNEKKKYIRRVVKEQTPFPTYKRRQGVTTTYLFTLIETKTESMALVKTLTNQTSVTVADDGRETTIVGASETFEYSKTESYTIVNTSIAFETYKKWDVLKISLLVVGDIILIGLIVIAIYCLIKYRRNLKTRGTVDIGNVSSESDDIPEDFKVKIDPETHLILFESQEQNFPYKDDSDKEE